MKRAGIVVVLVFVWVFSYSAVIAEDSPGEYSIKSMEQNSKWVMVEKHERVGAGTTVYYLHKDKIISIVLDYPNNVTIKLSEDTEYKLDFISNRTARQFVRELVAAL